jgi:hypothetical protein
MTRRSGEQRDGEQGGEQGGGHAGDISRHGSIQV